MDKRKEATTSLKQIRVARFLTQQEVAEKAGIKLGSFRNLEQGSASIEGVKLLTLLKICEALDCSLEQILEGETLEALKHYKKINK